MSHKKDQYLLMARLVTFPLLHRVSVQAIFSRWLFSFYTEEICCDLSVQFSHSVVSNALQPHRLQHVWLPCPSPTPRVYSNSYPLSRWCHPTISSSVVPFSSCLQSFPASGSFPMSQFFASSGQSIGASASASVLPMIFQDQGSNPHLLHLLHWQEGSLSLVLHRKPTICIVDMTSSITIKVQEMSWFSFCK